MVDSMFTIYNQSIINYIIDTIIIFITNITIINIIIILITIITIITIIIIINKDKI